MWQQGRKRELADIMNLRVRKKLKDSGNTPENLFCRENPKNPPKKLVDRLGYVASRAMFLFGEFYRKLTVPQEVLQEVFEAQTGEDRIRTCGTHTSSRI